MDAARQKRQVHAEEANGFAVERGPDWLFVRLPKSGGREAVRAVGELLQTSMTRRVVLELDRIDLVDRDLAEAISSLGHHVEQAGGAIRLCGLNEANLAEVRRSPGAGRIPHYGCRAEAVRASRDPAFPAIPFGDRDDSHSQARSRSDHSEPVTGTQPLDGSRPPRTTRERSAATHPRGLGAHPTE